MKDDPWLEEFEKLRAADPDSLPFDEPTLSFHEQIVRGIWPVRMPAVFEIYVEGTEPHFHFLPPGKERRKTTSQLVKLTFEYDQAKVREITLERIHSPRDPNMSRLPDLVWLTRIDRDCFLKTGARHMVELLAKSDQALVGDHWLVEFLRELHDFDIDLIGELVAETSTINPPAGTQLRDVFLEAVRDPRLCEYLGWMATASIAERLEEPPCGGEKTR